MLTKKVSMVARRQRSRADGDKMLDEEDEQEEGEYK